MIQAKKYTISIVGYYLIIIFIGFILILASNKIGMMNQNDFSRAVGFMLSAPTDSLNVRHVGESGFVWLFQPYFPRIQIVNNTSSIIFGMVGLIQKGFRDTFSLYGLALVAKVFLLVLCHLLTKRVAELMNLSALGKVTVFAALAITMFYAHNIALLNSFYQEYAFFLFLPLLLLSTLLKESKTKVFLCVLAALFCGAAKTQYFYIPLLLLIVFFLNSIFEKTTMDKRMVFSILIVQFACIAPLAKNEFRRINYYHSTFLGSYLVLDLKQLRHIGIDEDAAQCIGIDAWGNRLSGPGGTVVTPTTKTTCMDKVEISLKDVLIPYLKYPETAVKIWSWAMPEQFTVDYFHVSKQLPYLIPTDGKSYGLGKYLIEATKIRDKIVSPIFGLIIVMLGIFFPFIKYRSVANSFRPASLFLGALTISQVFISFLGEGVRDLNKHLWAAQYSLDLLILVLAVQSVLLFSSRSSELRLSLR